MEEKTKLQFKTTAELWKEVLRFRIMTGLKNNNDAVEQLIKKGLTPNNARYVSDGDIDIPEEIDSAILEFISRIPLVQNKRSIPLLISKDKKSNSFFAECRVKASDLIKYTDQDLSIDPELQEEYKANRKLEPDNRYFLQMVEDAKNGRSFSDIVIEFDISYRENKPLKILGGQHRDEAIKRAFKDNVNFDHGIRVYFSLDKDQRAEIMRISNTNINVSPDLRDRIEEHRLEPSGMLRHFCFATGIMETGSDFGAKKSSEDFNPTVRMIRSFIVNFYKGKDYRGDIYKDAEIPYLCLSGSKTDSEYLKIFKKFKDKGGFKDPELIIAGKNFAELHNIQFIKANKMKNPGKKEFRLKAYSYSVITSWAFAAGVLQTDSKLLKKLYDLPNLSGDTDPLNSIAMAKARHKSDPEAYRGLGTRTDNKERGRLLQLFLNYSKSEKPKINDRMCQASMDIFHSNDDSIKAEKRIKNAF